MFAFGQVKLLVPKPVIAERAGVLQLEVGAPTTIQSLPAHSRLTWLSETPLTAQPGTPLELRFIPQGVGTIRLDPLDLSFGGTNLLQRISPIRVERNRMPANSTRLDLLWNGSQTPPDALFVGQQVDLEIILRVVTDSPKNADFPLPDLVLDGVRWENFGSLRPEPRPADRLFRFGNKTYQELSAPLDDRPAVARRYKARFTVNPIKQLTGVVAATAGHSGELKTHLERIHIPVLHLPDPPRGSAVPTGLVGDWTLTGQVTTSTNGGPLTVSIDIQGSGDSRRLTDLDFSRHGFLDGGRETQEHEDATYDRWHNVFEQTLLPDGQQDHFPALELRSFDTDEAKWVLHPVSDAVPIAGAISPWAEFAVAREPGSSIRRPILANLKIGWFALFGLAPFIPLLFGLALRLIHRQRDPVRDRWQTLLGELQTAGDTELTDHQETAILNLLRENSSLPPGASLAEVAEHAPTPLRQTLSDLAHARFRSGSARATAAQLADALVRSGLPLLLCLLCTSIQAAPDTIAISAAAESLDKHKLNQAVTAYTDLVAANPSYPNLYYNLGLAQAKAGNLPAAAAALHTGRRLNPRHTGISELQAAVFRGLGRPELIPRGLTLRPDQWVIIGAIVWALAWLCLALRRLRPRYAIVAGGLFAISVILFGLAFQAGRSSYAPGQFMVVASDTLQGAGPSGNPDHTLPSYRPGDVLREAPELSTSTHIGVSGAVYLPRESLQAVW